jgi:predicted transcriptional regulator
VSRRKPRESDDPRFDTAMRDRCAALRQEGQTVRQIAATVGRSPSRVHDYLKDAGLTVRRNHRR